MNKIFVLSEENTKSLLEMEEVIETVENVYKEKSLGSGKVFPLVFHEFERADYCQWNVPSLPSFVPVIATKYTTVCQPVYH